MKKESVNKFDLEAAFKALNEIETPVVKGIKPNRENLQEKFTRKLTSEILVEDYYDVNSGEDLEAAQEEREAEIAKAKLARIEKIVDLEAESEDDLLPSYVGKVIIQCPQCMTLFYKNQEDIEKSEENPEVVNINEVCQHCGNASGYSLIGKVDQVGEEEAENYDVEDFDENELDLDFPEEGTEEVDPEGTGEAAEEGNEEKLDLEPIEETEEENSEEESEEEEEVKESLTLNENVDDEIEDEEISEEEVAENEMEEVEISYTPEGVKELAIEAGEEIAEETKENPEISSEEIEEIVNEVVDANVEELKTEASEDISEEEMEDEVSEEEIVEESLTENTEEFGQKTSGQADEVTTEDEAEWEEKPLVDDPKKASTKANDNLTEAVDKELDDKLKAHNEYIEYLKKMIQAEEDSLGKAKNEFVKKSIQARIDALKADLEAALPEVLKGEVETELPTPEESGLKDAAENKEEKDEEVKESLNEEVRDLTKIKGTYSKLISDNIQQIFDALEQRKSTSEMKELVLNIIESAHDTPAKRGFIVKLNKQSSAFGIANLCKNAMLAADKDTRLNKWSNESLEEDFKIIADLSDYEPWSGAIDTWNQIKDANKIEELDSLLEDMYPDGLTMTELNDILWFDNEEILNLLGIGESVEEDELDEDIETEQKLSSVEAELEKSNVEDIIIEEAELKENPVKDALDELENSLTEDKKEVSDAEFRAMLNNPVFNEKLSEDIPSVASAPFEKAIDRIENAGEELTPEEKQAEEAEINSEESNESLDNIDKDPKEDLSEVEDFNDESFDEHVNKYLKEVYSNVAEFNTTSCSFQNKKLVVEGSIKFSSGKTKTTKFVFEAAQNELAGTNTDLAEGVAFSLAYSLNNKELVTESFKYSYKIDNSLVEGLIK